MNFRHGISRVQNKHTKVPDLAILFKILFLFLLLTVTTGHTLAFQISFLIQNMCCQCVKIFFKNKLFQQGHTIVRQSVFRSWDFDLKKRQNIHTLNV